MEPVCKGLLLSAQTQLPFPHARTTRQEFHVHKLTPSHWHGKSWAFLEKQGCP